MSYLCSLALRIWTSFWRREDSDGMDMWNASMVQSRQPLTYRLTESVGLGGPRWHGNIWQRGIAESGSSQPSTLMIDIPGDLVWDLPCMQQASYLERGPLVWMLLLYLNLNQKSYYDDDMTPISAQSSNSIGFRLQPVSFLSTLFIKAYVVGTHLNCIDLSMQFKGVPTTYAFIKEIGRKTRIPRKASSHLLGQKSQEPQSECGY